MRAVNLIPAEQRSGQPVGAGRSQGGAYAVLVLIAGLALMAFVYGSADHQISSARAKVASVTAQAQQAQVAAERLAPYTSFIALREQRTQAVEALVDSRFDWAHVLHEFGRVLPAQASITSLGGTIGTGARVRLHEHQRCELERIERERIELQRVERGRGRRGHLGDAGRQRADVLARGMRHQPV